MDGQGIDTSGRVWKLRSSSDGGGIIRINLDLLSSADRRSALSRRACHLANLFLVDRIARRKSHTVENDLGSICRFDQWLSNTQSIKRVKTGHFQWSDLNETLGKAFLTHGAPNMASKGNDFSLRLRAFYRWGVAHQYRDFHLQTLLALQAIPAIGNTKGHHVRFHDPDIWTLLT